MVDVHSLPVVKDLSRVCKHGSLCDAVCAREEFGHETLSVSVGSLLHLLGECAKKKDLAMAKRLHLMVHGRKTKPATLLVDNLIRTFASCGSLADANQVFSNVSKPSVFTWNAIILAHAKLGEGSTAIDLYSKMHIGGALMPHKYLLACILKVCTVKKYIDEGRLVHHEIISYGLATDVYVDNALVFMYVECGSLEEAQAVFEHLKNRNVATWSALITGYAKHGNGAHALELFQVMQGEGTQADNVVFLCLVQACSTLRHCMYVHKQVVLHELEHDIMISSALVNMYAKCGSLHDACVTFNSMRDQDAVLWSSLIAGCIDLKQDDLAMDLFHSMLSSEGTKPNDFTFSLVLKACGNLGMLEQGRLIHDMLLRRGMRMDVVVGNTLIDMYEKCRAIDEAYRVFDRLTARSVVSWGTMINAFADHGDGRRALQLYDRLQGTGLLPDDVIFLSVVKACATTGDLSKGRQIHSDAIRRGFLSDVTLGNTVVDMYMKCKSMGEAQCVFDGLLSRNAVSWTAMLTGYAQNHQWAAAVNLYEKLQDDNLKLDRVVFLKVLEACGNLGTVRQGMLIHDTLVRQSLEGDTVIGSALLDTYCKCGYVHEGYILFERLPCKDSIAWGAMIGGLVHDGNWTLAKKGMLEMRQHGMKLNEEMYICILIACSCAGLLDEGQWYFNLMKEDHQNYVDIHHFSCMVDLLGRAGLLEESKDLMQTMPSLPNDISRTSLLSSCRTYRDPGIASHCLTLGV